ncbi:hypothetical protein CF8_0232 [Aeromonas phage CF8]|nr:hypothetical protein CF8_0232 [Aeromonas phage CF8]
MIDTNKLSKNVGLAKAALRKMPDNSVIALKKVKVCFPKRFEQSGLADIADSVETILMVGLIHENSYCTLAGMCRVVMKPGDIYEENIKGDRYYVLEFEPGDVVIENLTIPQDSNIGYSYYLELVKFARIPWYATAETILSVFDESGFYTGKSTGMSNQAIRVLYALTGRDPKNIDIPFRYSPDLNNPNVHARIIGINNPGQLLNSTFSRLTSGYMSDNIISGLLNPDQKVTVLEEVIRGLPSEVGDNSNV